MSKNKYRIACSYLTNTTGFFVSHLFLLKLISSHSCPCHLITISISPHRTSTKFTGKLFFLCLSLCCLLLETLRGKKRKKKRKNEKIFWHSCTQTPTKMLFVTWLCQGVWVDQFCLFEEIDLPCDF